MKTFPNDTAMRAATAKRYNIYIPAILPYLHLMILILPVCHFTSLSLSHFSHIFLMKFSSLLQCFLHHPEKKSTREFYACSGRERENEGEEKNVLTFMISL